MSAVVTVTLSAALGATICAATVIGLAAFG